jgi:hypothetical protein
MGFTKWGDQTAEFGKNVAAVQRKEWAPTNESKGTSSLDGDQLIVSAIHYNGQKTVQANCGHVGERNWPGSPIKDIEQADTN